jgi:hypothetical protein
VNYAIPLGVIQSEYGSRATGAAKGFEESGLHSHVLLAACKSGQTAKERSQRGAFTYSLLELLKEEGVDRLTYRDVITRLPDLPLCAFLCLSGSGHKADWGGFSANIRSAKVITRTVCFSMLK